jgi:pyruvate/2-oxoglutarate dehydrogenase complex dihydrolipoamide dehydrogenase (E3) component
MKYSNDVIILGGGAAGLTAASGLAQLGMKVALIEKEHMGGDCLYYGCVPSKSLLKAARVRYLASKAGDYGLPPLELPPVQAEPLINRISSVIQKLEPNDSPERFTSLGCEVYLQNGRFHSDHAIELEDGTILDAKHIIISTGSSPSIPPIPGLKEVGYLTNKDIFQLKEMPQSLITLGAGPIGVELSQALGRLGVKVTLIDMAEHVLPREDEDMAAVIEESLLNDGINLELGVQVLSVSQKKDCKRVAVKVDGKERVFEAEQILVALGREGNSASLNLEAAGIETDRSFIPTDKKLRTNRKHILSLGDINGKYLFTHTAGAEGSFAVKTIGLKVPGTFDYSKTPWSTYCDPELASVGYNEKRAREEELEYRVHLYPMGEVDRAMAEGESEGMIKLLTDKKDRIIGSQIVSIHAGELLIPSLYAVNKKWNLMDLMGPVFPYPTFGEVYKKAVGAYAGPKLFNPRVRKILKGLYGYRGPGEENRA